MVLFHSVSSATQRSTSWSLFSTATRSAALYLAIQVDVTNLNDVTDVLLSVNWRILTYSKNNVFFIHVGIEVSQLIGWLQGLLIATNSSSMSLCKCFCSEGCCLLL